MHTLSALLCLALLLALPSSVQAAGDTAMDLPYWSAVPFVLLLLCIAVLPLIAGHWWHSNRNKAVVAGSFAAVVALFLVLQGESGVHALLDELGEYFSFIVFLGSLYTIAGGIVVEGDFRGRPLNNTLLLLIGTCLASFIGTTGASMLLIRPFLRMNHGRARTGHLPVFFIFTVSNTGGLLTPLGDPPLFLGFVRGIDFVWTMQNLWYEWAVVNVILLAVFFCWDSRAAQGETLPLPPAPRPFRVHGLVGFVLLAGVIGAVLSKSFLAGTDLEPYHLPELAEILLGLLSLRLTPAGFRKENRFSWGPIIEVAVLFVGIFVAMVPALELLGRHGGELGVSQPWQYFWLTGGLSSFLDNAPTYVTFGTLAAESPNDFRILMSPANRDILAAISCGAVFMGANTYIGNGPNFMVKALAEENGYPMPSFLGYMGYSCAVLLPIFALLTYEFFIR